MTFLDGMYLYEVVLLVGGAFLFLVFVLAFLRQLFTNRSYVPLLPFFLLPVAMMGFPGISSIQVKAGVVAIEKKTHYLQNRPDDQEARASLEAEVAKVSARSFANPNILTTLAQAQFAVGQEDAAESNLNKALSAAPNLAPAAELKTKIELTKNLTRLTSVAETQPDNPQVREELQQTYSKLSQQPVANPKALGTISKARIILETRPANANPRTNVLREPVSSSANPRASRPND